MIDRMARMLEAHAVSEDTQWIGMKEWIEDREMTLDERPKDNVLCGLGITDITVEVVLATVLDGHFGSGSGSKPNR
jgi:hypothetical protein